jgi:hypothetical protein
MDCCVQKVSETLLVRHHSHNGAPVRQLSGWVVDARRRVERLSVALHGGCAACADLKPYQFHWGSLPDDISRSRECQRCGRSVPIRNVIVRWLGDED